ncbi:terpene synthase family protein [Streptomyces sp. NPDC002536]
MKAFPPAGHLLYRLPACTPAPARIRELDDAVMAWADGPAARDRLSATLAGELIARAYPGLRQDRAADLAGWFAWLFLVDDLHDPDGTADAGVASRLLGTLVLEPGPAPDGPPLVRHLAHVWQHIARAQSRWWRMRFLTHTMHFLTAFRYEALYRRHRRTPALREYVQLRRASGSVTACLDLLEFATGREVPPLLHETDQLRGMFTRATDVVVWVNDVVSLEKELHLRESVNGVLVLQRQFGLTLQEAVNRVYAKVAADVHAFHAHERELQRMCSSWPGLTERDLTALASFTDGMRAWMRANLDWSAHCARYRHRQAAP